MISDNANNHSCKMSSFRITKDDRFFSRLLAKETTTPNSSSRIFYYGETTVAVPFTWEAQPGTPKHPLSETSLPPLTPPPSYFSTSKKSHIDKKRNNSKGNNIFFSNILPRFVLGYRKSHNKSNNNVSQSSSWSPSSSSSSSSSNSMAYYSSSPSFSHSKSSSKHKCSNGFRGCYPFGKNVSHSSVD